MNLIAFIFIALLAPLTAFAKLNVVATTEDLGSIAREIGGNRIEVTTLARPSEDPHFVDAKPSFIARLNRADALIEGGAELEIGWLPPLLEGARNPKLRTGAPGRIACARGITMLEVPERMDRSMGDIHAAGNPHFMTDPANGRIVAGTICEGLCALDPDAAGYFRDNLAKFDARITEKMAEWEAAMARFQGRRVVAYHNAWLYFANRFGIKIDTFLEPKPGIPPTPANLAAVIEKMKSESMRVILVDARLSRKTAEKVVGETGAIIVPVTQYPGGVKGTENSYIGLIDYLVSSVSKALAETAAP